MTRRVSTEWVQITEREALAVECINALRALLRAIEKSPLIYDVIPECEDAYSALDGWESL